MTSSTVRASPGVIIFAHQESRPYPDASINDVWEIQPDGSRSRPIDKIDPAAFAPVLSPDGAKVAFSKRVEEQGPPYAKTEIFVSALDGSDEHPITDGTDDEYPSWAPDGKRLAFARMNTSGAATYAGHGPVYSVFTVGIDGQGLLRLTDTESLPGGYVHGDTTSSWAPDGKYVVVSRQADGQGNPGLSGLYILPSSGGPERRLTVGYDGYPAWSPEGSSILFIRNRAYGTDLWKVPIDGSGLQRLTTPATPAQRTVTCGVGGNSDTVLRAAWSSAADRIVLTWNIRHLNMQYPPYEFFTMASDGSDLRLVRPEPVPACGQSPTFQEVLLGWPASGGP